jgi:O-antigen ligase
VAGVGICFLLSLAGAIYFDQYWLIGIPFGLILFFIGWKDPRWIFYLLIFLIPFSTEIFFENGFSTDFPDEALMWLVSIFAIASAIFRLTFNEANYKRVITKTQYSTLNSKFSNSAIQNFNVQLSTLNPKTPHLSTPKPLLLIVLIWTTWILVTASISPDPFLSLKFFLAKCWYVAAFVLPFLIWKEEKLVGKVIAILLMAILLATGFVLWQHSKNGFSFASVNEAVRPFFRNHVNYSAMLVCALPMIYFLSGSGSPARKRIFFLLGLFVLAALYFSYARGAWLALLAGGLAYYFIRARLIVFTFVSAIILAIGSIVWFADKDRFLEFAPQFQTTIFHEDFREHLVATYRLKDISTAERFHRWIAGVNMVGEHPIGGIGPNRFYEEYKPYTLPAFKTWVSDNPEGSGVHNYFLLLAIEQGVPGLISFLILAGAMLYFSQRIYHRAGSSSARRLGMMVGVMVTMILTLNFLSDLVETDKIGSLFFICLGILIRGDEE